jgi:hypothetical protein
MDKQVKQNKQALAKNLNQLMPTLPSEHLKNLAKNIAQVFHGQLVQEDAQLLGECLIARFTRRGGNPARRYWKEGRISAAEYLELNSQVDIWDMFYDLIQLAWDDMKRVNSVAPQKFPFEQEQDLFLKVLADKYNTQFCVCLRQYYKYSPAKVEKARKMIRSAFSQNKGLTHEQQQEFYKLIGDESENVWFVYASQFFIDLAKVDPVVAKKLEEFKKILVESSKLASQQATHKRKSGDSLTHAWHDDQLLIIQSGSRTLNFSSLLTYS